MFPAKTPRLFVSPHLDDVAISCGHLISEWPGATVLTVCGSAPNSKADGWDRRTTGKETASDAINVRRTEDLRATTVLRATPVWLDFFDSQYPGLMQLHAVKLALLADRTLKGHRTPRADRSPSLTRKAAPARDIIAEVAGALGEHVKGKFATVFAPLGVLHPDHVAVSEACLSLSSDPRIDLFVYLDMPYGHDHPRLVDARLSALRSSGYCVGDPIEMKAGQDSLKRQAVNQYVSQLSELRKLAGYESALTGNETYWPVAGAP
jgi:LmbE family N-acetylglucosaminyl deacetylase